MVYICSYADCMSVQTPGSRYAFFVLPQDHRRCTWIQNSGNDDLLEISATARRYFCELHFQQSDIRRQFNRCILRREAIPLPYRPNNRKKTSQTRSTNSHESVDNCKDRNEYGKNAVDLYLLPNSSGASPINQEDLIVTDYEGSSRISSIQERYETQTDITGDEEIEFIMHSDSIDENELPERITSPTAQSSIASNVIIQETASISDEHPVEMPSEEHLNESVTSTSLPEPDVVYPIRRVMLRRRKLRAHQQSRTMRSLKTQKPKRTQTIQARRSTPDISLEEVAGKTEDTYFALSLVGSLERLSARKRATAKLHILQYLTELAFAED